MGISIVTETWPPEINGVALTVQSLARGVHALGHDVEVVRPRQGEADGASTDFSQHLVEFAGHQVAGRVTPPLGVRLGGPDQGDGVLDRAGDEKLLVAEDETIAGERR